MKHKDTVHLLLVEDDDTLAKLIQEYLRMHLFEVSRVAWGEGTSDEMCLSGFYVTGE